MHQWFDAQLDQKILDGLYYKDSKIDVEFEKLKDALDKDGNEKISFSEWNQVVGSLYTAVKLEDSGELTNQEFLELLHLAILFEFNFHDKNQDGILTEFWVLFNDADTNRQGPLIADGIAVNGPGLWQFWLKPS